MSEIAPLSTSLDIQQQSEEIISLVKSLRSQTEAAPSLSSFATKIFTSIHSELLSARENAATIWILDVLNHVNSEIVSAVEYEDRRQLLNMISNAVLELLDADIVTLYEIREAGEYVKARPGIAGKLYHPNLMLEEVPFSSTIYEFVKKLEPTFMEASETEKRLSASYGNNPQERFVIREQVKSTVVLPLVFSNKPVGVMFINFRNPQEFGEERKRTIRELSGHIALAMHNMRSYRRTIEFNRKLEKLFDTVEAITRNASHTQGVLDSAVHGMVEIMEVPRGAIVMWYSDKGYGEIVSEYDLTGLSTQRTQIPKNSPLQQRILHGEICNIWDVSVDPSIGDRDREILLSVGVKSTLIVPIINENQEVVASIGIDETRNLRRFFENDVNLCKILAGQVATALRLADSTSQLNQRVALLELQQGAMTLLAENEDPDLAFKLIVEEGLRLIGGSNGQLLRLRDENTFLETDYSTVPDEIGLRYPLDASITGQAARTAKPVLIRDFDKDPHAKKLYKAGYADPVEIKSELAVPIIDKGNSVIGVLNAESNSVNAFTTEHEQIWLLLASNIAKLIRLTDVIAEKNALTSLSGIQRKVLTSEDTDLVSIVGDIIQQAIQLADATDGHGHLLLPDEQEQALIVYQSSCLEDVGRMVSIGDSNSGNAYRSPKTVYIDKMSILAAQEFQNCLNLFSGLDDCSTLYVPLVFDGKAIGVIALIRPKPYAFTQLHARLVEALASQAAIVIQQSKLLKKEGELSELEIKNRLEQQQTRDIANILHRLNNPLGAIRQFALLAEETLNTSTPSIESVRSDLKKIQESVDKTARLVLDLRGELRSVEARDVDLNQQIRTTVEKWRQALSPSELQRVEITLELAVNLPFVNCSDKITYVIGDLLNNAYEAVDIDQVCQIKIETHFQDATVMMIVSDNGSGIPAHHWDVIFDESFHTKKPKRLNDESGGIGLWWDRRYVRGFGGDVFVAKSEVGFGTSMVVKLQVWTKPGLS